MSPLKIKISLKILGRQRGLEGFDSGVNWLIHRVALQGK
jgi:hypothetical protein